MLPSFLTLFPRHTPPLPQTPKPPKFLSSADLESYPAPGSLIPNRPIHDQLQSPLFGKIPPEIRNEIFKLVLSEYVPGDRKWGEEKRGETVNYVRRPGYEGVGRVRTEVVGVCWRVYQETSVVALRNLEVCFYMGQKARAPKEYTMTKWTGANTWAHPGVNWFKPEHWPLISHIHIFPQLSALHQGFTHLFRSAPHLLTPTSLTLTLRYTDWWYWETNTPIFPLLPHRFFSMKDVPLPQSLEKVTVEFETIETKVEELEGVVGEMLEGEEWFWRRRDGRVLRVCGGEGVSEVRWEGPSRFGGRRFAHHGEGERMGMVVKRVVWRVEGGLGM